MMPIGSSGKLPPPPAEPLPLPPVPPSAILLFGLEPGLLVPELPVPAGVDELPEVEPPPSEEICGIV